MNKKGMEMEKIITLVILLLVLVVIAVFVIPKIVDHIINAGAYTLCENQFKDAGCFSEAEKADKEVDGFWCKKGTKSDGCLDKKDDDGNPYYCCLPAQPR